MRIVAPIAKVLVQPSDDWGLGTHHRRMRTKRPRFFEVIATCSAAATSCTAASASPAATRPAPAPGPPDIIDIVVSPCCIYSLHLADKIARGCIFVNLTKVLNSVILLPAQLFII